MLYYIEKFEHIVVGFLIILLVVVILLSVGELAWVLIWDIITLPVAPPVSPPVLILDIDELLDVFGLFLLVLIGIELLESLRAYLKEHLIHIEVVLRVAIIAIARKVITMGPEDYDAPLLIGIGVVIVALGVTYFLAKSTRV